MHHRLLAHMFPFAGEVHQGSGTQQSWVGKNEALHIFQTLFTEEEAEIASDLSFTPEEVGDVSLRTGIPQDKLVPRLETMAGKGLIYADERNGVRRYSLLLLAPGIMELQFMKGEETEKKRELARLFDGFFDSIGEKPYEVDIPLPRVLPVEERVPQLATVLPYERVSHYIQSSSDISLSICYCRHQARLLGKSCGKPIDVCMTFGPFAKFAAQYGFAKKVSEKKAMQALDRSEEAGLVHLTENCQEKISFICNCCGCCCYFMKGITRYDKPNSIATSSFICAVDSDMCNGCGVCVDRCQVKAIAMEDSAVRIDKDRCIGCGVCMSVCPTECMRFELRETVREPLRDSKQLRMAIAMERMSRGRF